MKLACITTQSLSGSTVVGRVLPLAGELAKKHKVHVIVHKGSSNPEKISDAIKVHYAGKNPFVTTVDGKVRHSGLRLILRIILNVLQSLGELIAIQPDAVIIVKPLPENVLAVWLWRLFNNKKKIIVDVDDFELMAQKLSSIWQRAVIHWSERTGAKMATHIVTATPFLQDHFRQLTNEKQEIYLIPTGLSLAQEIVPAANAKKVVYVGSVSTSSGHRVDLLPQIFSAVKAGVPDAQFVIAGSGDDIESVKQELAWRGLSAEVEWRGRFSMASIAKLLRQTSVLVDPVDATITNRSKSSFRVMLAGLYGIPVVTSNVGIRPMLLPDELHERFFAQPADANDYTAKITALLIRPLSLEEINAMKERAAGYTWDKLAGQYDRIIAGR